MWSRIQFNDHDMGKVLTDKHEPEARCANESKQARERWIAIKRISLFLSLLLGSRPSVLRWDDNINELVDSMQWMQIYE